LLLHVKLHALPSLHIILQKAGQQTLLYSGKGLLYSGKGLLYSGNNIIDFGPRWILVHFELKFCWEKLFALVVTSIIQ
jgi:hypothetical protein